jgi:molecular chaperone DnaJ
VCVGSGKQRIKEKITVHVREGVYTGISIRHPGLGDMGAPGAPPGDLFIVIEVKPHRVFKRDGAETYVTVPVPYPVMVLGGEVSIPTVHGEHSMMVSAGTESGAVVVRRGDGIANVRNPRQRGDHHVRLVVDVPRSLNEQQEEAVRGLADVLEVGVGEKGFWKELFHKFTG